MLLVWNILPVCVEGDCVYSVLKIAVPLNTLHRVRVRSCFVLIGFISFSIFFPPKSLKYYPDKKNAGFIIESLISSCGGFSVVFRIFLGSFKPSVSRWW